MGSRSALPDLVAPAPRPRQAALTLPEVMIAIAILVIAILSTFSALGTSHQVSRSATIRARVMEKIQKAVEEIQSTDFGGFSTVSFDVEGAQAPPGRTTIGIIEPVSDIPNRKIKYRIEAQWMDDTSVAVIATMYTHANRGY